MFGFFRSQKKTKTGMIASSVKTKKLKTRKEMRKMHKSLPPDYKVIAEGTFCEMSQITPQVYLTGIFGLSKENFDENRINNVINVSYECPELEIKGISHLRILVDDDPQEDLSPHLDMAADYIDAMARKGGRTVVHCVAGVSRSTAVVLAYLIKYKNMTLRDAFKLVYQKRPIVKPIIGFMRQLIEFEKKIRSTNSCQIVKYKKEGITVTVPDFWITECSSLVDIEIENEKNRINEKSQSSGKTNSSFATNSSAPKFE